MMLRRLCCLILVQAGLAGCGAETAGTAAVGAAAQVHEAEQARQLKDDVQQRLDATMRLEQQRLQQQAETAGQE